jgi:hypothetical protein
MWKFGFSGLVLSGIPERRGPDLIRKENAPPELSKPAGMRIDPRTGTATFVNGEGHRIGQQCEIDIPS